MARKSFTESTGCSLFVIALVGIIYALPYLFMLSVYAFPLFLAYLLTFARWGQRPAIETIGEDQVAAAMRSLLLRREELTKEIEGIKNRGAARGVRYIHIQDRFEMRSRRGQEFNQELDSARSLLSDVVSRIEYATRPQFRKIPAWLQALSAWRRGRSFRRALCYAFAAFVASAVFVETSMYQGRRTDLLVWNPAPGLIGIGIEVGSTAGWVLGLLVLSLSLRFDRQSETQEIENLANEVGYPSEESPFGSDEYEDSEDATSYISDPYDVLNVSRAASTIEIKEAYRSAMKRCHPDTVADRSQAIRDAAEAEAVRLNAAYDLVRSERGFS